MVQQDKDVAAFCFFFFLEVAAFQCCISELEIDLEWMGCFAKTCKLLSTKSSYSNKTVSKAL